MVTTRTNNFNEDLTYIVRKFLKNNARLVSALELSKVQNRNDLLNLVNDPGKWASIKWRNPQTQQEELLSDDLKLWVEKVVSFINWMQNNYGGKVMYTVDLSNLTHEHFQNFCTLLAVEGGHPCQYDHDKALQSEVRNKLGVHAPPPPSNPPVTASGNTSSTGGNNSSNSRGNSTQLTAIQQQIALFVKSLPSDINFPTLDSNTNFMEWALTVEGYLELRDISILSPGYSVPTDTTSDEYKLYSKQNTFLYMKLKDHCKTSSAVRIIKAHRANKDGRSAYLEIEKENTGGSLTAELRAKYFHNLIHTMVATKSPGQYVAELSRFHSTVAEYNAVCDPGAELDGEPLLVQFERFITPLSELKLVENNADAMDRALSRRGVSSSSRSKSQQAKDRMDDYDDAALRLDNAFKGLLIGSAKAKNTFNVNMSEVALYDAPFEQLLAAIQASPSANQGYSVNVSEQSLVESQEVSAYIAETNAQIDANVAEANAYYEVNTAEGEGRRYGYLPKAIYNQMDPASQRTWMSLPARFREMIIVYHGVAMATITQDAASRTDSAQLRTRTPPARRGILKGTGVATGTRAANQTAMVPVSEGNTLLEGNTATISDAIESNTFGATAFLDSILQRSVNSAKSSPAYDPLIRERALRLPAGHLHRLLSPHACDNTPTVRIVDDESVPELRENNTTQIRCVTADDSITVPSTVTDSYNTFDHDSDDNELSFFDALD